MQIWYRLPLLADRFMGMLRFRCFEKVGAIANIEELQINFQPPDRFRVKIAFSTSKEKFSEEHSFSVDPN
ncbi:MAG: hypothetical protein J7647_03660 [Cyanobacteria bacterium SBLK]|nr:hypothetical protein [Cyanobacteria bacterium SBLK]